jgi:F-box/leucine-rich repeat protein 2/20
MSTISTLDLTDCSTIDDSVVENISKNCKNLVSLSLGGCFSITTFKTVDKLPLLRLIDLHDCRFLVDQALFNIGVYCPDITELNLSGCSLLGTDGMMNGVVANCTKLRSLNVSNCRRLDNEVVLSIAKSLKTLSIIKLSGLVSLTKEPIAALAKLLKTSLTTIKLNNCYSIFLNRITKQLTELYIADESIFSIAEYCPSLEQLDLSKCKNITNAPLMKIAERCSNLKSLGCVL